MKTYIGTKIVKAQQMAYGPYRRQRGWETTGSEENIPGYKVIEDECVNWYPKDVFEKNYREITENERTNILIG